MGLVLREREREIVLCLCMVRKFLIVYITNESFFLVGFPISPIYIVSNVVFFSQGKITLCSNAIERVWFINL